MSVGRQHQQPLETKPASCKPAKGAWAVQHPHPELPCTTTNSEARTACILYRAIQTHHSRNCGKLTFGSSTALRFLLRSAAAGRLPEAPPPLSLSLFLSFLPHPCQGPTSGWMNGCLTALPKGQEDALLSPPEYSPFSPQKDMPGKSPLCLLLSISHSHSTDLGVGGSPRKSTPGAS